MARIILNKIWDELGKIWKELENIESQEQEIALEPTRLSGSKLATLLIKRLERRKKRISTSVQVFNENDLLPFSFFETGLQSGKSVCCIVRRITKLDDLNRLIDGAKQNSILQATLLKWYGIDPVKEPENFKTKAPTVDLPYASGFLVGGDYLLTNRHVVGEKNLLPEFCAVFKYEADFHRQESGPELLAKLDKYKFVPDFWITSSNTDLDYLLLKLSPLDGESVKVKFGAVNLAKTLEGEVVPGISIQTLANDLALKDDLETTMPTILTDIETKNFIAADPIHMIQHPGGRPKEVVVFNNRLVNVYENFIEYETDAEPGSSGSPLFNTDWQVVGIHQAALIDENSPERKVKGYLGIRIDCILADLQEQSSSNSELLEFLENYIERTAPRTQAQVFILAGRRRSFLGNDAVLEQESMENLRQLINQEMNRLAPHVRFVAIPGNPEKPQSEALNLAVQLINQQRNPEQQGELAIELLINRSEIATSKNRSIKLYYSAANARAQQLALCLQTVLKEDNPLFSISALPDSYTITRRLGFCRNVNLPAVVIYVGDVANAIERNYIERMQQDPATAEPLATSLTKGILKALEKLETWED
ncbi:MAG: serine protease [Nostoc desertorum CM1-VF14]|jgi:hypothetical protein|nr:serine protease [Nostoc desertorum CM1-VF14]